MSTSTRDTTPPTVSIAAPAAGTTTAGTVTLTATASDNVAVASVQFQVDGTSIGSPLTSSPYTTLWNSKSVADGSHTLSAIATDTSGNSAIATTTIAVRNTPPVISSIVTSQISSSTETIAWTTDEAATSQVNYGLTTSYGSASSTPILATSHSITLTGLTASTTYDFQIQSTDAENNTATSTNQTFTTASFNYYVDSVNGSDTNPGTSPALAFQNITALPTISNGMSVGLADGSDWRQQLTISGSNVAIAGYGSGARPILDASDIIPNASFAKSVGYTNVYNTGTITFACKATYGSGCSSWVNVWETGASGDNATGQFLTYQTSIANVDSTACTYYISGGQTTGGGAPASATIYVHSCDGTSPITNGYTYEFANRRASIYSNANNNVVVSGIEGRKAVSNTGPFDFENDDGDSITLNSVLARDCNDHCTVLPGGSTITNSIFVDAYWGGQGPTLVVNYETNATGKPFTLTNNIFQNDQNLSGNIPTGLISHAGNLGSLGPVTSQYNWFIAKNGSAMMGYELQYAPNLSISGDHASQLYQYIQILTPTSTVSISNSQMVSSYSSNTQVLLGATGTTLNLSSNQICTSNEAHQFALGPYTGTTITDSGSTYYLQSPQASTFDIFSGPAISMAANNDTFDGTTRTYIAPYNFTGSGGTFSGGTITGTANSYKLSNPNNYRFQLNGTTYNTVSTWLAAVSPQDSAATTTRSGISACTLPTIPTVN